MQHTAILECLRQLDAPDSLKAKICAVPSTGRSDSTYRRTI